MLIFASPSKATVRAHLVVALYLRDVAFAQCSDLQRKVPSWCSSATQSLLVLRQQWFLLNPSCDARDLKLLRIRGLYMRLSSVPPSVLAFTRTRRSCWSCFLVRTPTDKTRARYAHPSVPGAPRSFVLLLWAWLGLRCTFHLTVPVVLRYI
ncbi:hypothetical protein EXIGLDRAFT_723666 [Exidia glandulosa HHB12029]|uniref:Uncharacterized protein n=1 Tax=Exidia glandulosa HHB12029 TaxID=1314781 RepID=A0A165ERB3_EXIGL|nr:hypothetical protein EXIGLDRAFT_723666 [Exidia glandulosa HHB12029]